MILVTLGTQDKSFKRLLVAIEKVITDGNISDEVVVQAGCTKYESDKMKIFDFMNQEEFNELITKCDLVITHAGVGTILNALKLNKKVIVAARLKKYKEHTNDHQVQIIKRLAKDGYVLELSDFNDLSKVLKDVKLFKPKKYKSNTDHFINLVEDKITSLSK